MNKLVLPIAASIALCALGAPSANGQTGGALADAVHPKGAHGGFSSEDDLS